MDEGVLEFALLKVEIDDRESLVDHAAKNRGDDLGVEGIDLDAPARLGRFAEGDVRRERGPLGELFDAPGESHFDEGGRGAAAAEALGAAVVDDATLVDEKQRIAHLAEFGEDVRADQDGFSFLSQDADEVFQLNAGLGIETGGGFIEDEDFWIVEEGPAETEPLPHALAKGVDEAVGESGEVGELHDFGDALNALFPHVTEGSGEEVEILEHRHVAVGAILIGHPADAASHLGGMGDDVVPADEGLARRGVVEGREDAHRRGLAGPVRPDETDHLSALDGEGDVADRVDAGERTGEVPDLDCRREGDGGCGRTFSGGLYEGGGFVHGAGVISPEGVPVRRRAVFSHRRDGWVGKAKASGSRTWAKKRCGSVSARI